MRLKSFLSVIIIWPLTFFLTSCFSTAQKPYLQDYSKLREVKRLKKYWSSDALPNQSKYSLIYVKPINIDRISNKKEVAVENCRVWLWNGLIKSAAPLGKHISFMWTNEARERRQAAVLEVVITEMAPGSSGARMLAGEFNAGHAWVHVEGKIFDINTNEELVAFSAPRHASGVAALKNKEEDAGPTLVRELLEQIADDIMLEIKESFLF